MTGKREKTKDEMVIDALDRIAALLKEVKGRHNATVAYCIAVDTLAKLQEMTPAGEKGK